MQSKNYITAMNSSDGISELRSNFPGGSAYKIGKSVAKNITEIETFIDRKDPNYERKLLDAINDKDLKNKNFNFIKQEAYEVTKNIIIGTRLLKRLVVEKI